MNTQDRTFPVAIVALIAIAMAIAAIAAAALVTRTSADHLNSVVLDGYTVTFDGATDNGDGTSTWTYTVAVSDAEGVQALSHWVLGLDLCAGAEVISADPDNVEVDVDPTTGVDGIKWDNLSVQPGQSDTYSVTIDAELGVDVFVGHVDVGVKGGQTIETGTINGPDCTLEPPTLTVIKTVVNDDGGTAVASDFTMTVTATNPSPASFPGDSGGTAVSLDAGAYSVSETGPSGYAESQSADCSGTIAASENKTCTITNDDVPPATTTTPTPTTPTGTTTTTPTTDVLGETQAPEALPDTGGAPAGGDGNALALLLLGIGGLALLSGAGTLVTVAARRRREPPGR